MGFLILLFCPNDYDVFIEAKSKKRKFTKIAYEKIPQIPSELVRQIEVFVTNFDNSFRTPEAHGPGVLRKYTFLMEPITNNPQIELIGWILEFYQ